MRKRNILTCSQDFSIMVAMIINNKEKQFAGGNWSSDKWTKEHTKVSTPEDPDEVKHRSNKKKAKKQPYIYPGAICPFCKVELPDDLEEIAKRKSPGRALLWVLHCKVGECPKCGAKEVTECPACKRSSWFRQGWYQHQKWSGCGFSGFKKVV